MAEQYTVASMFAGIDLAFEQVGLFSMKAEF